MSSFLEVQANRRNSQKPTGPRSPEGKAASRFNALASGIDAQAQIIRGESAAALEALTTDYRLEFEPSTPVENFLVDALVCADWQLRRLRKIEAKLWNQIADSPDDSVGPAFDRLTRLERRIDAAERSYYRALKQLQRLHEAAAQADALLAPDLRPPASEGGPALASFRTSTPSAAPLAVIPPPQTIMTE